ncbi:MAG: hypothetical protein EBR34_01735 [Sphingomonadaceae bacterium]|nr:hypothetical protein [Sphingomonadaceae bacterium]
MNEPNPWFAAKRFGYGAGLPIAWQGWALLAGYVAVIAVVAWLDHQTDGRVRGIGAVLFLVATAAFVALAHKRTEGGWKWRGGRRD